LVGQICGGFWFRFARQLVIFGAKQQYRKGKNIIFKCGKIIKKNILYRVESEIENTVGVKINRELLIV
jgi:hypothetical protein